MIQREVRLNAKEHSRFIEVMKKKIADKEMTIADLAEEINVSPRSIYNFCKDTTRNPSKFLAAKIANYLDIKPSEYRSKGSTSFFGVILVMLTASFVFARADAKEVQTRPHIVIEESNCNVEDEVLGIDYGTDFTPGWYEPIVDEDIPISPQEQLEIQKICADKNICPELVYAIIETESRYNPNAVNASGTCKGAMQINTRFHKCDNPFDLIENVDAGTTYLQTLFNDNEDVALVLSIYHGETDALQKYNEGKVSSYARHILERSEQLERKHGK